MWLPLISLHVHARSGVLGVRVLTQSKAGAKRGSSKRQSQRRCRSFMRGLWMVK